MLMIYSLIVILFSAIIHEYMHGWMADRLGDATAKHDGRLTLNPIAHIDPWGSIGMPALLYFMSGGAFIFGYAKPVSFNPYNLRDQKYGVAKVAVAGPFANLVLAIFFGTVLRFLLANPSLIDNPMLITLLAIIVQINIVLMIFNLLPIPPLDGSKIITPFLSHNMQEKFYELEKYGLILVFGFVIFGFQFVIPVIEFIFKLIVGVS